MMRKQGLDSFLVESIIQQGESDTRDFQLWTGEDSSVLKTICAFANTKGGSLLLGVTSNGKVKGVADADNVNSNLRKSIRLNISPHPYVASSVLKGEQNKSVLIFDVPDSKYKPYTFENVIFVRREVETIPASGEMIRDLIVERHSYTESWEKQLALGESILALDEEEVRKTAISGNNSNLVDFGETFSTQSVLEEIGLIEGDSLCNGAIVLFGTRPQKRFPQTRIRAVRYRGLDREHMVDNRVFEGNAFKLLNQVEEFLRKHVPIESVIPKNRIARDEGPAVPFEAIREAIINAVVHRDYASSDGGINASVYEDRLEIWNSGTTPEGVSSGDELANMVVSRPHNPDMAHVFLLRQLMERVGSGIQRIIMAFRQNGLPEPKWSLTGGGVLVVMRWRESGVRLNKRQSRLLATLASGEAIKFGEYWHEFAKEVKDRQARADLKELVDLGYLRVLGKGRGTVYERTEKEQP